MVTREEARDRGLLGWNIRCNRCGSYGADWLPGERPGYGALALCPEHAAELRTEHQRHKQALAVLRRIAYEQDGP